MQQQAADNNNAQPQQQGGIFSGLFGNVLRMIFIYWLMTNFLGVGRQSTQQNTQPKGDAVTNADGKAPAVSMLTPLFAQGTELKFSLYITSQPTFSAEDFEKYQPIWEEKELFLSSRESNHREKNITISSTVLPEFYQALTHNESAYLHGFFSKYGVSPNPMDETYKPFGVHHITYPLNRYLPIKKDKRKKLLEANDNTNATEVETPEDDGKYGSYFNPDIAIAMVDFADALPANMVPPHMKEFIKLYEEKHYYPIIYFNDFWVIRERLLQLNDTVTEIPMRLDLNYLAQWKFHVYLQMELSFSLQKTIGTIGDGQSDEVKRMFLETNPYLLGITLAVSMLHSIFDFLAFKNDISFWKNKKDAEGLSVRAIMLNCFFQFIIFLYLLDNDTNWMIIISTFVGMAIEIWKLGKAMNIKFDKTKFPFISFEDKASYSATTKEHDETAHKYLFYACIPLMIGYAIYSMVYDTHKSWYSFIVSTIVGFIYTFGFIMMTPQLFINYKLKTVAHMPWKSFMYKALNTIVDDLFSFVIKMPTLHRLSCFRDDIIFLIYLYQRWIYPVDKKRANEYGQVGEETPETAQQTPAAASSSVPAPVQEGKEKTD